MRRTLTALVFASSLSSLSAQSFFVSTAGSDTNTGSMLSPWRTITHAATTAPSKSLIHVAAGTYGTTGFLEGIEIKAGKLLTIRGAGIGATIVQTNAAFTKTIPYRGSTRAWTSPFLIHGAGTRVDVSDMTIDAMHLQPSRLSCMVYSDGAGGRVRYVEMRNAGADPANGAQGHVGFIAAGKGTSSPSSIALEHCWIHGWNKVGVVLAGDGLTGSISHCVVEGSGPLGSGKAAQNGIQLGTGGGPFTVRDSVVRDIFYTPSQWNAVGVLVFDTTGSNVIEGNRIYSCKTGYYLYSPTGGTSTFDRNQIGACQWGINVWSPGGSAKQNSFDADTSISIVGSHVFPIDKNSYADLRTNSGWPSKYVADGNASVQDVNPVTSCQGYADPVHVALGTGAGPKDIVVGDFNGDGKPDFAAANAGTNKVSIHFGSGGTDFTTIASKSVAVAGGPIALATGEFSQTAGLDLAVISGDGVVRVLLNNGSGTFTAGPSLDLDGTANDAGPTGIAAGQINGAAGEDIVVSTSGDGVFKNGAVAVLYVESGPSIRLAYRMPETLRSVESVHLADLNADGKLDVLAADASNRLGTSDKLQVWLHSAVAGVYKAAVGYAIGGLGRGVTTGDLDGDGKLDVAVACASIPGAIHVFEGSATGVLTEASHSPFRTDSEPESVFIGDLQDASGSGDPRVDVVAVHGSERRLSFLLGYGDGGFAEFRGCAAGLEPVAVAFAKLDADDFPDMLLAHRGDQNVSVRLGAADAISQRYGVGCVGSSGVPEILGTGSPAVPTVGNASFGIGIHRARGFSVCVLLLSVVQVPSTTACSVQLGPTFLTPNVLSGSEGDGKIGLPVPNNPAFAGFDFYAQWAVLDPSGGFLNNFALSDAMRFRVGF